MVVPSGLAFLTDLDSDQPVAAGAVLDDDGAIEKLAYLLGQQTAKRVAAAAGREGKDQLGQRAGLAERIPRYRGQRQTGAAGHETSAIHCFSPRQTLWLITSDCGAN